MQMVFGKDAHLSENRNRQVNEVNKSTQRDFVLSFADFVDLAVLFAGICFM
jgi:hypothetical protein